MRMSAMFGRTLKENPRDAELTSHRLLVRAGYVRRFSAGVYGLLPLAMRSFRKIETIVKDEMDRIGGQEVKLPCMMTKELWDESGRYAQIDASMFRFQDRSGQSVLLGMTHEEPTVALGRTEVVSYKDLPGMVYQINTKFRDEPRARGGLIRLREFVMKDAYSYHTSEDDLQSYYDVVKEAYNRIFRRAGCKNFTCVMSDNGMFGGRFSHEFMLLTPCGEDTLITCTHCDYKANQEIAATKLKPIQGVKKPMEKIATPNATTIASLAAFLKIKTEDTSKAVLFETPEKELVIAFVRGDREIVETKLVSLVQSSLVPATPEVIAAGGAYGGSTGPVGLKLTITRVVIDPSALDLAETVIGANEADMHYKHFNFQRDFLDTLTPEERKRVQVADIIKTRSGDLCPECGHELAETRGIEIGNIFHLGDRYSKPMNWTYLADDGRPRFPIMGCYGLGISRLLPAIVEEGNDERGMILPITVAPYEVHLTALNYHKDPAVKQAADALYQTLTAEGCEVLFDDRDGNAGSLFADADLIGIPLRLTVAPKSVANGVVEFKFRDQRAPLRTIPLATAPAEILAAVKTEYARYR